METDVSTPFIMKGLPARYKKPAPQANRAEHEFIFTQDKDSKKRKKKKKKNENKVKHKKQLHLVFSLDKNEIFVE